MFSALVLNWTPQNYEVFKEELKITRLITVYEIRQEFSLRSHQRGEA